MAITEADLLLVIGSEAILELNAAEKTAICAKYSAGQEMDCKIFTFGFLSQKFRPSYRMGSTFEAESDKFKFYDELYKRLCASVGAGRTGIAATEGGSDPARNDIERQKWPELTRRS